MSKILLLLSIAVTLASIIINKPVLAVEKSHFSKEQTFNDNENCDLKPQFNYKKTGLTVVFSDKSKGIYENIIWDFGDGNSSKEFHPTHTYSESGTYTFKQTITSSEGCSKTFLGEIYIK